MAKIACYPEDDVRISKLMEVVKKLDEQRERAVKELRSLIYKVEKPR